MKEMKTITTFRWWLAAHLVASGLAWVILSIVFPLDVRPFWLLRRAVGVLVGAVMLSCAYFLAIRLQSRSKAIVQTDDPAGFKKAFLVCAVDGFLVFSIASFLFNIFLVLFRRYDFDPTLDVLHFIPTFLIMNTV